MPATPLHPPRLLLSCFPVICLLFLLIITSSPLSPLFLLPPPLPFVAAAQTCDVPLLPPPPHPAVVFANQTPAPALSLHPRLPPSV